MARSDWAWKEGSYNKDFLVNSFIKENIYNREFSDESPQYPACNLMYYILLCTLKPNLQNIIVETGSRKGFSTSIILQSLIDSQRSGKIYAIEISEKYVEIAKKNITEKNVEFIVGNSLIEIPKLLDGKIDRIDFAFLDGSHKFKDLYKEFNLIKEMIKKSNGYIYFDNISACIPDRCEVQKVLKQIKAENDCNIIEFPFCSYNPPGQALLSFQ